MSWTTLAHTMARPLPLPSRLPAEFTRPRPRHLSADPAAAPAGGGSGAHPGLGAARAGSSWRWAAPASATDACRVVPAPAPVAAPISVPVGVLREMREAARASGRSESAIWAEAAREWLRQRQHDDGPLPPAPCAALPVPRRARSWDAIDAVLADLREVGHAPTPGEPAA